MSNIAGMVDKITFKFSVLKRFIASIGLLLVLGAMTPVDAKPSGQQLLLANELGWIVSDNPYNVCGGYYRELPIAYTPNPRAKSQRDNYDIAADQSEWTLKGDMTFSGHVKVTQAHHQMQADRVHVKRNKAKQVISLDAVGNLRFIAPELLAIARQGSFNLVKQVAVLKDVLYSAAPHVNRVKVVDPQTGKVEYRLYKLNARGRAKEIKQVAPHIYKLSHASYTACPPTSNTWKVSANHIKLDYTKGWGSATNALLYLKDIPVFYFPYYSFPISQQRHSGFLTPFVHYSDSKGAVVGMPFYWNMAPNYDMTLTPQVMTEHGFMASALFRYFTTNSYGGLYAAVVPHDFGFASFQRSIQQQYGDNSSVSDKLSQLEDASTTRAAIAWNHTTHFTQHLYSQLNFNYVSDDYYTNDFYNGYLGLSGYQLLQKASLNYADRYWSWQALLQRYQTLHPIDRAAVENQYQRLPEINFTLHPFPLWGGFTAKMRGQFTNFYIEKNPDSNTTPVYGNREVLVPTLSWPLLRSYGFWRSNLALHSMYYNVGNPTDGTPQSTGSAIPIFDSHGKLIFTRPMRLFHGTMRQTFEPEIYYLYAPFVNQNKLPIFDTTRRLFSYSEAFSNNRFSGDDRVGDANQVTLGATSRFINNETGEQRAQIGIAEIYYFRDRRVQTCYGANCPPISDNDKRRLSPIAAQLNYNFAGAWHFNSEMAWNPIDHEFDNNLSYLQYRPDGHHILNFGYNEVHNEAVTSVLPINSPVGNNSDLKQAFVSTFWQVQRKWAVMGAWNHNWSKNLNVTTNNYERSRYNTWLYGVQYNSCCWAFRVVGYRSFTGLSESYDPKYDNGVYFEFSLKGLGQFGESGLNMLLNKNINGYRDDFGQEKVL
ncbi:MAG: LPS assembly protein LptD [Gammaproteobacteria bacterium]|nr:LPS assembly protein LptD [Gammaproteobacteria bacterium]